MTETAAWLALHISSGTTATENDSISASVSATGMAARSYSNRDHRQRVRIFQ